MKVSLLLPTRDRLEYLRYAIETVLRQEGGPEWELVVSDNNSADDIAGHVESLSDPRVVYVRTERLLPVTENWNNALARATGDYALMLGDDDGLVPGALARFGELVDRFERPDLVYSGAWLFSYPGVMPGHPGGLLRDYSYAEFLRGRYEPYVLPPDRATRLVRRAMAFRLGYGFNMQLAWLGRALLDDLGSDGPVFRSEFPDYYAMNAAFLRARRIVAEPRPLVVIGVTPKSYGFFHARSRDKEGRELLDPGGAAGGPMPGSNINTGWLSALDELHRAYGAEIGAAPSRRRYRFLQIAHVYEQVYVDGTLGQADLDAVRPHLGPAGRVGWAIAGRVARLLGRVLPRKAFGALRFVSHRVRGQFPHWNPEPLDGSHRTLVDVFEDPRVRA